MNIRQRMPRKPAAALLAAALCVSSAFAQVGKSQGLLDINTAGEKELLALPHMTPAIVKSVMDARPFDGILSLNKHLLDQKLTREQTAEVYDKAFIHINLNTATREEIMLIPGAGKKMAHEFDEYRPWKSWAQFAKEIGKYVGEKETARLAQYCFIPMNVNKATEDDLATIPGMTKTTIEQLGKTKPWKSIEDVQKELAKAGNAKDAARIARYLVVE